MRVLTVGELRSAGETELVEELRGWSAAEHAPGLLLAAPLDPAHVDALLVTPGGCAVIEVKSVTGGTGSGVVSAPLQAEWTVDGAPIDLMLRPGELNPVSQAEGYAMRLGGRLRDDAHLPGAFVEAAVVLVQHHDLVRRGAAPIGIDRPDGVARYRSQGHKVAVTTLTRFAKRWPLLTYVQDLAFVGSGVEWDLEAVEALLDLVDLRPPHRPTRDDLLAEGFRPRAAVARSVADARGAGPARPTAATPIDGATLGATAPGPTMTGAGPVAGGTGPVGGAPLGSTPPLGRPVVHPGATQPVPTVTTPIPTAPPPTSHTPPRPAATRPAPAARPPRPERQRERYPVPPPPHAGPAATPRRRGTGSCLLRFVLALVLLAAIPVAAMALVNGAGGLLPQRSGTTSAPPSATLFTTPTGNIVCRGDAREVRCDIARVDYRVEAAPAECRRSAQWGHSFVLRPGSAARLTCPAEALSASGDGVERLEFGQSRTFGSTTCTSTTKHLECRAGSHRFRISRGKYSVR